MTGRMDVVGRVSGRRRWSDAEKLETLADAFRPGVRVCDVIARRQLSSSLIYTWRKQLPADPLLRSIDRFVDLSGIREELKPFYNETSRPPIDPELMIRIPMIGYCMGIRSERRLCDEGI